MRLINVPQQFEVYQSDPDPGVERRGFQLFLNQNGKKISGFAKQQHQTGQVEGDVGEHRIWMEIKWQDGKRGGYEGFLHGDRRLRGTTRELDYNSHPVGGPLPWWSADGYTFHTYDEPS